MTRTEQRVYAAAIALLSSFIVTAPASAQTLSVLHVDCYGYGSIENTGTNNLITVRFYDGNRRRLASAHGQGGKREYRAGHNQWEGQMPNSDCSPGFFDHATAIANAFFGREILFWGDFVKYVQIRTSGEDAFWIDQLKLETGDGGKSGQWGANEGQGYCLSGDPTDANRSWRDFVSRRGCQPCFEFQVDEKRVVNCPLPTERINHDYHGRP